MSNDTQINQLIPQVVITNNKDGYYIIDRMILFEMSQVDKELADELMNKLIRDNPDTEFQSEDQWDGGLKISWQRRKK